MKVIISAAPGGRVVANFGKILSFFFFHVLAFCFQKTGNLKQYILFQIIFSKWRKFATKNNSLV
jgi:hypothetical protein